MFRFPLLRLGRPLASSLPTPSSVSIPISSSSSSLPSLSSSSFPSSPSSSILSSSSSSSPLPLFSSSPHRLFSTILNPGDSFTERTAAPSLNLSIWDKIFNRSKMPNVDLTESFPSLPALVPTQQISAHHYKMSTLSNGMRVVTLPSASPVASIGIYVSGESRYENDETAGLTHFLELMSLKSTETRTDFRLVRETMKMGVAMNASSGREHFTFTADCLHEFVAPTVATFADLIQNNLFHLEELMEEKELYEAADADRSKNMDIKMLEAIHEAAYGENGLGRSLYPPLKALPQITKETLSEWQKQFFTPKRMVFTSVGVDHQKLITLIEEHFGGLAADTPLPQVRGNSSYVGGDSRMHIRDAEGPTHVAIAWESPSWNKPKEFVPMCVLQSMMGGGGSFSAGGPGKGMYSRLYSNILSRHDWVHHLVAFNATYTDTGLFGLYGITDTKKAGELVDVMSKEAVRMAGPIDPVELTRAKNSLKSGLLMQLESRGARLEDVGRQLMIYNKIQSPTEVCAQIDKITADDVRNAAQKLLNSNVSFTASGDCHHIPRYDQIQKQFKKE